MGGYGVGEIGTGTSEHVDRMVNGTSLTTGSAAGLEASEGDWILGAETGVNNELVMVGRFAESDRGWFYGEVLCCWIRGKDVETFPKNPFRTAWIISGAVAASEYCGRGG